MELSIEIEKTPNGFFNISVEDGKYVEWYGCDSQKELGRRKELKKIAKSCKSFKEFMKKAYENLR